MNFNPSWEKQKLKDLCVKIGSGATPSGGKESYKASGISLIRSQNIYNHRFTYDGLAFIDENQAKKLENVIVQEDDVLLNITGDSVCRCCIVDKSVLPARVNQHVAIIRTNKRKLLPFFLKSLLTSDSMQSFMLSLAQTGGTRAALTKGMIENFEIPVPDLKEQELICRILAPLDEKIGINNAINNNLEEMAQALFKHWFVDFEFPNENSEPYKFSGGEFEESELGLIPKGWVVEKIGNCTKLVSRGIAPKYDDSSDKRVINQKCIRDGLLSKNLARRHNSKVSDEKQVQFGDILVNSTGVGTLGRVTQVYEKLINYTVDSHVTIIRPNLINGLGYMGCLLKGMQQNFEHAATGSTGQTELGREVIKQMKIVIPENKICKQFSDIYHSFHEQIIMNQENNSRLTQMRDTLLSKLMSGEIRVPLNEEYSQTIELPLAAEKKAQYSIT